jgi:hypothetical protein
MLDLLHAAEQNLPRLLASPEGWRGFKLDRHPPFNDRLLRDAHPRGHVSCRWGSAPASGRRPSPRG